MTLTDNSLRRPIAKSKYCDLGQQMHDGHGRSQMIDEGR
jgi:hypothetical protein